MRHRPRRSITVFSQRKAAPPAVAQPKPRPTIDGGEVTQTERIKPSLKGLLVFEGRSKKESIPFGDAPVGS
jgi:hypothetical protein